MLAEKFFLMLETIVRHANDSDAKYPDGAPKVRSTGAHVPIKLPEVT